MYVFRDGDQLVRMIWMDPEMITTRLLQETPVSFCFGVSCKVRVPFVSVLFLYFFLVRCRSGVMGFGLSAFNII